MTISFDARLSVPPHVLVQEMPDGDSVFINLETEQYFGLNPTGTRMWTVLVESESVAAAYEALREEYEVDPASLRADIEALLEHLLSQGLLRSDPA
jgi:hypothetical protein